MFPDCLTEQSIKTILGMLGIHSQINLFERKVERRKENEKKKIWKYIERT